MNCLPNDKHTINIRSVKIFIFIASVNILFLYPIKIMLHNNIENAIYNFSQIKTGVSKESVIKCMSEIRGVTQDYSVESGTEIQFYWPYTHRPPGRLIVIFDINGVTSVSMVDADSVIEWPRIVGHLLDLRHPPDEIDVILMLFLSLSITLWLVLLQYLLSGISVLQLLILSMGCTLLTLSLSAVSRISIIFDLL